MEIKVVNDSNNMSNKTSEREITLKDLFLKIDSWTKFIISKWKIILFVSIIGAILGFLYAQFKKPLYKADLNFVLQDDKSNGNMGSAFSLASQFGVNLGGTTVGSEFSGDNLLEFMKSRLMIEKTLLTSFNVKHRQITLAEYYIDFNELRRKWDDQSELSRIHFFPLEDRKTFSLKKDSILWLLYKDIIKSNLLVDKTDKKLSLINLSVTSQNEIFSKNFAENLVKNVSDFYVQTKTKKASQNVYILQKQTDSVRSVLNNAIVGAATSIDINPNPNLARQVLRVPSQKKQVDIQASTALLTELIKNLEMSRMSLLQETPLIQIIDKPILPLEKLKFGRLKGIVLGGFLAGFLSIFYFTAKRVYSKIMFENLTAY